MNEQIKKKIKKLLALSKSPNENEAMAALEKARKLMEENGLSDLDCDIYTEETKCLKSRPLWQQIIGSGVAWINGTVVRIISDDGSPVVRFHGSETDVFISKEMYQYLVKTVDRMAKQNIRKNAKKPYRDSYKEGMATSLYVRMLEAGALYSWANRRESQLAVIDKYVVELYKEGYETVDHTSATKKRNNAAFYRGANDGESVNLNRQTTGGKHEYLRIKAAVSL
ncbi:DUF2786 domain-containing protein [Treponema sp. HNW]|uniref:DUF2786 domain-containing protein n=1 Tax=Treponema sp. HNW TaxID=3116654 RepID=UPI003D0EB63F